MLVLLQSIAPANLLIEDDITTDVDAKGKEAKRKLLETFPDHNNELHKFLIKEYESLLRFGHYDYLKAEFEKHLERQKSATND